MSARFSTDQEVLEAGVYGVFHQAHRLIRSVLLLEGDKFPRCSQCAEQVRFELMYPVEPSQQSESVHIFELPLEETNAKSATVP